MREIDNIKLGSVLKYFHRFKISLLIGFLLCLVGCATKYKPPTESPPESWAGEAGFIYNSEKMKISDNIKVNDIAIIGEVFFKRTAVVKKTVQTTTAFGSDLILKKGTKLWGAQYSMQKIKRYESNYTNSQIDNNPIEWCGVINIKGGDDVYCLFWESKNQARYINAYLNKKGYIYLPTLSTSSGMSGPVPEIEEIRVDLGEIFTSELSVEIINKSGVKVKESIGYSGHKKSYKEFYWRWSEDQIIHNGETFKIKPSKKYDSFEINK